MKFTLLVACLGATLAAVAAPPQNVAGMKFRHTVFGRFSIFDYTSTDVLLNQDGTYTGLEIREYREPSANPGGASNVTLLPVLSGVSIPRNGTWTYRIVDLTTAEIVLDGRVVQLRFDDGKMSGRATSPSTAIIPDTFFFDSYEISARMANCSALANVAPGGRVTIGFVIAAGERRVLVRAVGPGLRSFGITEQLETPVLVVYPARPRLRVPLGLPTTSRATLDMAAQRAGAFPLPSANDAGQFLTLSEGAYTVEVFSLDRTASGEVLVEVYQLP